MSFQSLREVLGRRLSSDVPVLEDGDVQHAVEQLLLRRLPPAAFTVRVTPRRIRIAAVSPAVRQVALLLGADIARLLEGELQAGSREVQVTQW